MRPDVDGTISWHKAIQLTCDNSSWNEKGNSTKDPVQIGDRACSLGSLYDGSIGDEENNGNENSQQVYSR